MFFFNKKLLQHKNSAFKGVFFHILHPKRFKKVLFFSRLNLNQTSYYCNFYQFLV